MEKKDGGRYESGYDSKSGYESGYDSKNTGRGRDGYHAGGCDEGGYDAGGYAKGGYAKGGYHKGGHDKGGYFAGGYAKGGGYHGHDKSGHESHQGVIPAWKGGGDDEEAKSDDWLAAWLAQQPGWRLAGAAAVAPRGQTP